MTVEELRVDIATGASLAVRLHRPTSGPAAGVADPAGGASTGVTTAASLLPVLCVHGLASNARMWDGAAEVLARQGHTVAAVDQRGHGRSDAPDEGYDFATLTGDLVAVLDALGWDDPARPPVVAGQSWGGNVVVELAARHPGRVGALVLVDGGTIELTDRFADWPTCEAALTPPAIAGTPWGQVEDMIRRSHPDWPESGIEGTLANLEHRPDGTAAPRLSLRHHMAILRNLWEHHPSQRWASMQPPVLIVPAGDPSGRGGRADAAKREEVDRALRHLPAGAVEWIDGDHDLHAQYPERIAALLAAAGTGDAWAPTGGRTER